MKLQDRGKLYNTESGFLQKFFVRTEDLGEGFTKYTTYRLYSRRKDGDFFLHVEKIVTRRGCIVFDRQDNIYPVDEELAVRLDEGFDELPLLP